jgi:hypothetical protein
VAAPTEQIPLRRGGFASAVKQRARERLRSPMLRPADRDPLAELMASAMPGRQRLADLSELRVVRDRALEKMAFDPPAANPPVARPLPEGRRRSRRVARLNPDRLVRLATPRQAEKNLRALQALLTNPLALLARRRSRRREAPGRPKREALPDRLATPRQAEAQPEAPSRPAVSKRLADCPQQAAPKPEASQQAVSQPVALSAFPVNALRPLRRMGIR